MKKKMMKKKNTMMKPLAVLSVICIMLAIALAQPFKSGSTGYANLIVQVQANGLKTATTKISSVIANIWSGSAWVYKEFTDTAQTQSVAIGSTLSSFGVYARLDKSYAATSDAAKAMVRIIVTLKNPAGGTVYSATILPDFASDVTTFWSAMFASAIINTELTEGNWVLSVTYQIYV